MGGAVPGSGLRGGGGRLGHPRHPRHRDRGAEAGLAQGRGHLQTSQGGQVSLAFNSWKLLYFNSISQYRLLHEDDAVQH